MGNVVKNHLRYFVILLICLLKKAPILDTVCLVPAFNFDKKKSCSCTFINFSFVWLRFVLWLVWHKVELEYVVHSLVWSVKETALHKRPLLTSDLLLAFSAPHPDMELGQPPDSSCDRGRWLRAVRLLHLILQSRECWFLVIIHSVVG